ncbi:hypothetical protein [Clostridium sp.]|uniref:hypothetical protein n=1 Tax=Clostridium sp. TaxID=1506 RepID=UPI00284C9556|nr:hypothetical protein [Clostridium sp.]MDR3597426.1 hypothetical protein [Clostridium sp.]
MEVTQKMEGEKIDWCWYIFDSEGYMLYDWKYVGCNWYYLGQLDYETMKTGWAYDKNLGRWYYLNFDGVMLAGWQEVDGKWYYLDSTGAMKTGWLNDGGKDYCLYSDGSMIHDCDLYGYRFDSNGVATKLQ